ncbi:tail fiber domain-containing protein [Hafnia paralvei]|uniref:tail fiber domain-containing protein n=1 Tax=Hafnia paralvei TaxID=546367 RepID=UPI001034DF67|nr:tail fiber domain-containing protein [Hafnia paralvei]TBM24967.1 tail fiber domain-containing protein [Hafnia paralvei]
MSLYETGTITGALNSTTISGTGTKWSDAKIGITNGSVLYVSSSAGMDGVYQIKRVINDTSIELAQPIYKAFTNSKYSILVSEASSTASFANQLAAALGYYQAQIDGWQQIMTGTGDVELTAPDGTKVTIKSFTALDKNKADIKDIQKLEKDKMSVGAFGLGLKKDSLSDSLDGASGFFGAGSLNIDNNAGVVFQSSYGNERRGQFSVNMAGNAYFRFLTTASDDQNLTKWKKLIFDGANDVRINNLKMSFPEVRTDGYASITLVSTKPPSNVVGSKVGLEVPDSGNPPRPYFVFRNNSGNTDGQFSVYLPQSAGTLALQGTSGRDYKRDVVDADPKDALDRIISLRMTNYIYKDDEKKRVRFGFIAEEAEIVAPQYIKHTEDYYGDSISIDNDGNEVVERLFRDRPCVDNNPIIMDLLGAIQALNSKVNDQEKRLIELEKMKLSMDK